MKLLHRFIVVISVIAFGLIIQTVLFAHLSAGREIVPAELLASLSSFDGERSLGTWIGKDLEIEDKLRYADQHFYRVYLDKKTGQQLTLWMVYSNVGEDRSHHPEVCFQVAGQHEDPSGRQLVEVAGHKNPVQQLRFGNNESTQLVYYWHYTLPSPEVKDLNKWQRRYQQLRQRSASITLQIFAPEMNEATAERATEFVKLVDAEIQPFVGPDAYRGCKRMSVVVINGEAPDAEH